MQTSDNDITLIAGWGRQRDDKGNVLPARFPLGVASLVGASQRADYKVQVRDIQHTDNPPVTALLSAFEDSAPIIGISCMSDFLPPVLLAIAKYKREHPDKIFILGGPGPTGVAEAIVSTFPVVDVIVKGEGERTLISLLNCLRNSADLEKVPGIVYRREGQVCANQRGARLQNLDDLYPLPLDAFEIDEYYRSWPISTSRGCPYNCAFCDVVGLWGRTTTWRSIDSIFAELNGLVQRGITNMTFVDDTFVLQRSRVESLCKRLRDEHQSLTWHCNGRINLMDERLLIQMIDGGCRSIFYGIESGSDRILARINKAFRIEQAEHIIRLTARYIQTTVSFIWGFPFETFEDFKATWEVARRLADIENVHVHLFLLAPFPYAPIHQEYGAQIVFNVDIRSDLNRHLLLSAEELELVRKHPTIFTSFWMYPTVKLMDKLTWLTQNPVP